MKLDLTELSATQIYHLLVQTVLPRPVAWILSEQANGKLNLAPFSFFCSGLLQSTNAGGFYWE
ncbi:hypothetical protein [Bacterioplanoides sp.]|uniref:hypothetical protein n=1 Tax=Bacterioplanoides sp. TaxID=2066072 RepID=UPI003B5AE39E